MSFAGVNYAAVLIAAIAGWMTGAVWYGALGKPWLKALGRTKEDMAMPRGTPAFYAPFVIAFVADLVMAWILAGVIGHLGVGQVTVRNGVISGLFVWVGFVATTVATNYAFAGRSRLLTAIDTGHWLAVLIVMGAVVGAMGV
jgi:hypothetical protein